MKQLKKTEEHIGRNIVIMIIKIRSIVRIFFVIIIIHYFTDFIISL